MGKVRVHNWGAVAAVPFKLVFSVSDNGLGSQTFARVPVASGLGAGQNTLLETSHTFTESVYGRLISIAIDGGKQVAEVDETNNKIQVYVGPAGEEMDFCSPR